MNLTEQFRNERIFPEKYVELFSCIKDPYKARIFVWGLSGSGKDTISNYMRDIFGLVKLRLSSTIKQTICETLELTSSGLEDSKRVNKDLRTEHHKWSSIFRSNTTDDSIYTITRLYNLLTTDSIEFDMSPILKGKHQIVCDVRTYQEAMALLHAGAKGIFLSRIVNNEYVDKTHITENNLLFDKELMDKLLYFNNQLILINNPVEMNEQFNSLNTLNFHKIINCENSSADDLTSIIHNIVNTGDFIRF